MREPPVPAPRRHPGLGPTLIAVLLLMAIPISSAAAAPDCEVFRMEGDNARHWQEGVWRPLRPGPLGAGEPKIVTGPSTRVEITCTDGSVLTIGPETEINLETLLAEGAPRNVVIQLIEGLIGMVAPQTKRGVELRSPLAVASVRSTQWLMQHGVTGTAVFVRAGRVTVTWFDGTARLDPGEGIDIAPPATAEGVKRWGQARVDGVTTALGFGWR